MKYFKLFFCLIFLFSSSAHTKTPPAEAWEITGENGESIIVENINFIDYTSYSMVYTRDIEHKGIRVRFKGGRVTLEWNRISHIKMNETQDSKMKATFTLMDGTSVGPIELIEKGVTELQANCAVGGFKISLKNLKSIDRVEALPSTKKPATKSTADIKLVVNTWEGHTIDLKNPNIMARRSRTGGPIVLLANGTLRVDWSQLKHLSVIKKGNGKSECDITMANGQVKRYVLNVGTTLTGKSDLGGFKVSMSEVKSIEVNN